MDQHRSPEQTLAALGLRLPQLLAPDGNSIGPGSVIADVRGANCTVDDGYEACALPQLAVLRHEFGTLDAIEEALTAKGYTNANPGFGNSPAIINGASDLQVSLFGEAGRHLRAAVGVSALPRGALVEVQMTVRVKQP